MKIKWKLLLFSSLFILVIFIQTGFVVIGFNVVNKNQETQKLSDEIIINMLQARRSEKDFLLREDTGYLEKNNNNIKDLQAGVFKLLDMEENQGNINTLNSIVNLTNGYSQLFGEVVNLHIKKGIDENSGLRGTLRSSVHSIEEKVSGINDEITVSMLMCRRHEKDYIIRGSEKYITRFNDESENLRALILKHIKNNDEYINDLNLYKSSFIELFNINNSIGLKIEELRENIHQVDPLVNEYHENKIAESALFIKRFVYLFFGIIGLIIITTVAVSFWFAGYFTKPINIISNIASKVADGNLPNSDYVVKTKDEIGNMTQMFNKMVNSLKYKERILESIAEGNGDFSIQVELSSKEDKLGKTIQKMLDSLNVILYQVNESIAQVSSGSDQVALASQSLSQGATQQASSLEEISASLTEINSQAKQNTENSKQASNMANEAKTAVNTGNSQMQKVVESMAEINDSAEGIRKVAKAIDDIAFQINLLALNANVEAARAGKYGKGFAVVADEVRNLAVRSGVAVKEASTLVEEAISAITKGNGLVENTAESIKEVEDVIVKVREIAEEVTAASVEQAQGLDQINTGLDQIDNVAQSNTASAEESASAAEQLSSQAKVMGELIGRFTLKDYIADNSGESQYYLT